MKILYGVQGTGNGHLSKVSSIYPILNDFTDNIDILISGDNYGISINYPIKYQKKGITFKVKNGKIDYLNSFINFNLFRFFKEINSIPFNKYDLIITDFEPISAWGAKKHNIPSVHVSHQASFLDENVPFPKKKDFLGNLILKNFIPKMEYVGIHFQQYGPNICTPLIKKSILNAKITYGNHFTLYLPWYENKFLVDFFQNFKNENFHIFTKKVTKEKVFENITLFPVSEKKFSKSMSSSKGVICNAGFVTPSEALYLGKRLLVIPLKGQYEQHCNVAALEKIGVLSISNLNYKNLKIIDDWFYSKPIQLRKKIKIRKLLKQKIITLILINNAL